MPALDDFRKLARHEVVLGVAFFIGAVAPGILMIQAFAPELVEKLETVKLLLLALAITMPSFVISYVVDSSLSPGEDRKAAGGALGGSFLIFYALLFIHLFFPMTVGIFVLLAIFIHAFLYTSMWLEKKIPRKVKPKVQEKASQAIDSLPVEGSGVDRERGV